MNNRHRRIARLKELEFQRRLRKKQARLKDLLLAMNGVRPSWEATIDEYKMLFKEKEV